NVRLGIIGMGLIGRRHADYLLAGKVDRGELVAVCRKAPAGLAPRGLKVFDSAEALIQSGEVEAVLIATPHFSHPAIGIAALERGLHVLVEKPIAAHKADADRFVAAHARHPKTKFAAMFQMRTEPRFAKIRQMIRDREIGTVARMN